MRREDPGLITGATRFASDIAPPGSLRLVFARSTVAHGDIVGLDLDAARAVPGVVGVYGPEELAALGLGPMPCGNVAADQWMTGLDALASERILYAGQPLAAVVAEDLYAAEDGAALVACEIAPRPVVLDAAAALAPDAPLLHPAWGTNVGATSTLGGGDVDAALVASAVRVRTTLRVQRQAPASMEGRAAVAAPDAGDGRSSVTAWISTQSAHHAKAMIVAACGWEPERLRVICPAVGGSFGLKEYAYPEEAVVCLLVGALGRPVRWVEDRRENLTSACHARESRIELELGADADGHVLCVDGTWLWDLGAHPSAHGLGPAQWGSSMITGPYRIAATRMRVTGVVTNKAPIGGYRGYGGPQAHLALERALDVLAAAIGVSVFEIRRRNLLRADELPWVMPSGVPIDSGDYLSAFEAVVVRGQTALAACGSDLPGVTVGLGVAPYAMSSGVGPTAVAVAAGLEPSFETIRVAVAADGCAVVYVPTSAQGQSHETLLAGVAATALGWPPERVRIVAGDTELTPFAPLSAVGSRTAVIVAAVVRRACETLAAQLVVLPEARWPGAEVTDTLDPPAAPMTYGVHGAVVALDRTTGSVTVRRYLALDDCGPRLAPGVVEGQLRGAVVQGIGAALLEELRFGADGTPLTAGFSDYLLPIAETLPAIEFLVRETPSPEMPAGVKGVGEAGIYGPPAAIAQALDAALGRSAPALTELPFTLERVAAVCR